MSRKDIALERVSYDSILYFTFALFHLKAFEIVSEQRVETTQLI